MNKLFFLVFFVIWLNPLISQDQISSAQRQLSVYHEVALSINLQHKQLLEQLFSPDYDGVVNEQIRVYVNQNEFQQLVEAGIPFITLDREVLTESEKPHSYLAYFSNNFNTYPTYNQYDSIMMSFALQYPTMAKYVVLGTLPSGRKILALRISKNVHIDESEPSVLYTATIHGNETAGYIFMLKLADYLLSNYGVDPEATLLLDSLDIWINPLANPDGTYFGGNHTVSQSIRYNLNNVDLNRNFPDPQNGLHPDGKQYQPETSIFMNLADSVQFTLSANFHGGAEIFNYPWDTWSLLTADNQWWINLAKAYADSCQKASNYNGYFNDLGTGYTHGYQWYELNGGRQDYMNYWHQCREVTIELSVTKVLSESNLDTYWNYNKRSLIDYLKAANYGLRGFVTDSATGLPIKAKIELVNFDKDSSHVYTYMPYGDYYRLLAPGYYKVHFSSPGYISKTIDSVLIQNKSTTYLDIQLSTKPSSISQALVSSKVKVFPNPASGFITVFHPNYLSSFNIIISDIKGQIQLHQGYKTKGGSVSSIDISHLPSGIYFLQIEESCTMKSEVVKFVIDN